MTPELRISRRAVNQIAAAAAWWAENRPLAPRMFEQELAGALRTIREHPTVSAPLKTERAGRIRRVLLARSRYYLYWYVDDAGTVLEVLACWHASRGTPPPLR